MAKVADYMHLKALLYDYVHNVRKLEKQELREALEAVSKEERYKLVSQVRSDRNCTALHYAAYIGDIDTTKTILDTIPQVENGELLKMVDDSGVTALHLAVLSGHTESLRCMIDVILFEERFPIIKIVDAANNTAMHYAVAKGKTESLEMMLDYASPDEMFELMVKPGVFGRSLMHEAALNGHIKTMECILKFASPDYHLQLLDVYVEGVKTPLYQVCSNQETYSFLLKYREIAKGLWSELCVLQMKLRREKEAGAQKDQALAEVNNQREADAAVICQLEAKIAKQNAKVAELEVKANVDCARIMFLEDPLQQSSEQLQETKEQKKAQLAEEKKKNQEGTDVRKLEGRVSQVEEEVQNKDDKKQCQEPATDDLSTSVEETGRH